MEPLKSIEKKDSIDRESVFDKDLINENSIDLPTEKLLNYTQAANHLGIHAVTLRRRVSQHKIEHYKIRKSVRFSKEKILAQHKVEAQL